MIKKIPQVVMDKAQSLLDTLAVYDYPHAGEIKYLGTHNDIDYYTPYYPDADIGFPVVYSFNKQKGACERHEHFAALHILDLFD